MPALKPIKKPFIPPGEYWPSDATEPVRVTPERIDHWRKTVNDMVASGLKIPVPYGHRDDAKPLDGIPPMPPGGDDKESWLTKYNAGFVRRFDADGVVIDPASEDDRRRLGENVKEISPQINAEWRDGSGRTWPDCVTHLAAVVHPVVAGQENFISLALRSPAAGVLRLSLSQMKKESDVADDATDESDDEMPDDKSPAAEPEADEADESPSDERVAAILKLLHEECGLALPDDAHPRRLDDFLRLLETAINTKKANAIDVKPDESADGEDLTSLQREDTGMRMSLETAKTPVERAQLKAAFRGERLSLLAEADKLLAAGQISKAQRESFTKELDGVRFSLNGEGEVIKSKAHLTLDAWKSNEPSQAVPPEVLRRFGLKQKLVRADIPDKASDVNLGLETRPDLKGHEISAKQADKAAGELLGLLK